jgi:hypothetical protein
MRQERLTDMVNGICMVLDGDNQRWWDAYQWAEKWITDVHGKRMGGIPLIASMPVTVGTDGRRRVWLPEGMKVERVGINVNGSLESLLSNDSMIDLDAGCGGLFAPATGNPDWPAYNIGAQNTPFSFMPEWPGMGGGRSFRGYYRHFKHKNYILLDDTCKYDEVIIEGNNPGFIPGSVNWVPSDWREVLHAWIDWKPIELRSKRNPSLLNKAELLRREYLRANGALKMLQNAEPYAKLISACVSMRGVIR